MLCLLYADFFDTREFRNETPAKKYLYGIMLVHFRILVCSATSLEFGPMGIT